MPSQYDTIQQPYDYIRTCTIALIERANVHSTIAPFINNARVLDLACGSGFYTHHFLTWGADSVLGVDLSTVMLDVARRGNGSHEDESANHRISFLQADCATPTTYPGGPFDVVFGAWLLNYAPDHAALIDMFRNIAGNLKTGGRFVAVTVPPTLDPAGNVVAEVMARPPPEGSGRLVYSVVKDVEEGIYFHVHGETPVGNVDFDCYHLRSDVYERAAREAGLLGELNWGVTWVPEGYLGGKGDGEWEGGATRAELETYKTVPNYGLLVVTK